MRSKKHWMLSAVAAMSITGTVLAADTPYDKEIAAEYPGAKTKVVDTRQINGVKVDDVQIESGGATTDATITENGDFLLAALVSKPENMPDSVKQVSTDLFGSAPTNVESFAITNYVIDVTVGGKKFDLKLDGTGRLTDIDSKQEISFDDPKRQPKASAGDVEKVTARIVSRWPGAKVGSVNVSGKSPGFFAAEFTEAGRQGWITLDDQGRTRSYSFRIAEKEVPKAVLNAVAELKGAKINNALRWTYRYWQLDETVAGDTLTLKVRPDGEVISVDSKEAHATKQAVAAKHAAAKK